ncbi:MAG: glycosyltransferase family 2 protein [Candidatus Alcyoniella australis]|nr:glycosyltransferase family 2 protein [Candidatus Alcyoniella australis]
MSGLDLSVLIPTKEEAGSVGRVVSDAIEACRELGVSYEVLVVDAGSLDHTAEHAAQAGARIVEQRRATYSGAILDGLDAARGQWVLISDADGSHELQLIPRLWQARDRAELVIAARYVPGGSWEMPLSRYVLSRVLNWAFAILLALPLRDSSSGYRLLRRDVVTRYRYFGRNLSIIQEIATVLHINGHRIIELPINFRPRTLGQSKSRVLSFGPSYLRTLLRLMRYRWLGHKGYEPQPRG